MVEEDFFYFYLLEFFFISIASVAFYFFFFKCFLLKIKKIIFSSICFLLVCLDTHSFANIGFLVSFSLLYISSLYRRYIVPCSSLLLIYFIFLYLSKLSAPILCFF